MSMNNLLPSFCCAGLLSIHAIASRTHFVSPEGIQARMRLIAALFLVFAVKTIWVLAVSPISAVRAIIGLTLYGAAGWLFFAALRANCGRHLSVAFSGDQPEHLVTWGPYRHIRHPFYASYCLTWLASAVAAQSIILLGIFACMTGCYWWAARFEEEKFSRSELAPAYARYRANTGMFLPFWKRPGPFAH